MKIGNLSMVLKKIRRVFPVLVAQDYSLNISPKQIESEQIELILETNRYYAD